ncbi:MAG: hypothetical protein ACRD9Q_07310 [Nitrososphaeraceae archaeon]
MPIEKRKADTNPYISHNCKIFHIQGHPIACIIDDNIQNKQRYDSFSDNPNLEANLNPTVGKSNDYGWVMILNLSVRSLDDKMDFTILPDDEFIEVLINNAEINFADSSPRVFFSMGLKDIHKISEIKQKLYELRQG